MSHLSYKFESKRENIYFMAHAPIEKSYQTARMHARSLLRVFAGRSLDRQGSKVFQAESKD